MRFTISLKQSDSHDAPKTYVFEQEEVSIGRAKDNNLALVDPGSVVSKYHARLRSAQGRIEIEDLGSKNYTFVNRQRLVARQPMAVSPGDTIEIGTFELSVEMAQPPSPTRDLEQTVFASGFANPFTEVANQFGEAFGMIRRALATSDYPRNEEALMDALRAAMGPGEETESLYTVVLGRTSAGRGTSDARLPDGGGQPPGGEAQSPSPVAPPHTASPQPASPPPPPPDPFASPPPADDPFAPPGGASPPEDPFAVRAEADAPAQPASPPPPPPDPFVAPPRADDPFAPPGGASPPGDPFAVRAEDDAPAQPASPPPPPPDPFASPPPEDDPFALPGGASPPEDPFAVAGDQQASPDPFAPPGGASPDEDPFAAPPGRHSQGDPFASTSSPKPSRGGSSASAGKGDEGELIDLLLRAVTRLIGIPWQFRHEFVGHTILHAPETAFLYDGDSRALLAYLTEGPEQTERRRMLEEAVEQVVLHQIAMLAGYRAAAETGVSRLLDAVDIAQDAEEEGERGVGRLLASIKGDTGGAGRFREKIVELRSESVSVIERRHFRPAFIDAYLSRLSQGRG